MNAVVTAPRRHAVEDPSQVRGAAAEVATVAQIAGFGAAAVDRIRLAVTELAENLHRHAVGGEVVVVPPASEAGDLLVLAVDRGPGVERFDLALADGYSTIGTMGVGLGTVRRAATRFDAVSEPGRGTVVAASFAHDADGRLRAAAAREPIAFDIGALGFAIADGQANGDAWSAIRRGARVIVTVADGLGHGDAAAEASSAVVDAVPGLADLAPVAMVAGLAEAARHTRGAAVTVAVVSATELREGGAVESSGLGNVALVAVAPDGTTRRGVSSAGTAGRAAPASRPVAVAFPAGGTLVLHTDGLLTQWDLAGRADVLRHDAAVIAAVLWRDFERGTDDSCVVVVRAGVRR